jgi:hypothetical protein
VKQTNTKQEKSDITRVISEWKTFCNDFPTLNIDYSLPSINSDFDVVEFLIDLISTLLGKASNEIQEEIIRWLTEKIGSLDRDMRFQMKSLLKECFICKINPIIPPYLFVTNPVTNQPGDGINIEIDKFDHFCYLGVNPDSEAGQLVYGGFEDMNRFLYDVIQSNTPIDWLDPTTNKNIATFEFIEQNSPTNNSSEDGSSPQDIDFRNNVINIKINNSYNAPDKGLIDFINDYYNSSNAFDPVKVITQTVEVLFGTLTNRINIDSDCAVKSSEFDQMINNLSEVGADDVNVELDNSFFTFSEDDIINIKKRAKDRQNGTFDFDGCGGITSSIDFNTVLTLNNDLLNTTDNSERVEIISNSLKDMSETSVNNVEAENNKESSKFNFLKNFLRALKLTVLRLFYSPKVVYAMTMLYYMVKGQFNYKGVKEWFQNFICVVRETLGRILEKLVKELLLPLLLRGLRTLIKCIIKAKITEKVEFQKRQKLALLGGIEIPSAESIVNTAIDFGFDSAESALNKNN